MNNSSARSQRYKLLIGLAIIAAMTLALVTTFTSLANNGPNITSSPSEEATLDHPYVYQVSATGELTITYSLTSTAAGMTINSDTGLIRWTPNTTDPAFVTVKAEYVDGSAFDTQDFNVTVETPPVACQSDLFGYWKLDETSGKQFADFYDSQDATFSGSGDPAFALGVVNGAVDFNGVNQRLGTDNAANPTDEITVMAWINPDDLSGQNPASSDQGILSKQGAFSLEIEENGDRISFTLYNGTQNDEFEPKIPENVIQAGVWTHVAATFDGDDFTLYINGTPIATRKSTFNALGDSAAQYYIGWNSALEVIRYFDGRIDEVAVFESALSAGEIQQLVSSSLAGNGYCEDEPAAPSIISDPVLSAVPGEPYRYDVNAAGNPAPTYSVATTPSTNMAIDEDTGVITWTPPNVGIFTVAVTATNGEGSDTQEFDLIVDQNIPVITSVPVTTAVVGQPYLYNVTATGDPAPTFSLPISPPGMTIDPATGRIDWTPTAIGTYPVTVEATNSAGTATQEFEIVVSDVPDTCAGGLSSYWRLDETEGTTFSDYTGANPASFVGTPPVGFTSGQVNGAIQFNGVDQLLQTGPAANSTMAFTLMAWINPTSLALDAPDQGIISKQGAFVLEIEELGDRLSFTMLDGGSTHEFEPAVPSNILQAGTWTHVAATFDNTTTALYINGQQIANEASVLSAVGDSMEPFAIGFNTNFDTNRYFNGKIDEVAVFNLSLSAEDIEALYQQSLEGAGYCDAPAQIVSTPLTEVVFGQTYTYDVEATGVPSPTYTLLRAPEPSAVIDATTGILTWTPSSTGVFTAEVAATNFVTDTQLFSVTVLGAPAIVTSPETKVRLGESYTYDVDANGVPAPTYELLQSPAGMTIDNDSGVISWTPDVTGNYDVIVQASNSAGAITQEFTLLVYELPRIISRAVTRAVLAEPYSYDVEAIGFPVPTFSLLESPDGMTIDAVSGVISWTPTATGSFNVVVKAENSGGSVTQAFSIIVTEEVEDFTIFLPIVIKP